MKSLSSLFRLKFFRLVVIAGMCACSPSIHYAQDLPVLGDTAREDLSPANERKLGEQIMRSVRRDPDYIDDGPVLEYLNKLGLQLLEKRPDARGEMAYDFEFFAVRDPVLNAFAFPGGFIGFHSGLLLAAQTESELASVMGHEIGHVSQRHIARMIANQKYDVLIPLASLVLAALAARSSPDAAMAVVMGGQGIAAQKQLSFSRDAEREADRIGFQILRDANFDTSGMVDFFGRLEGSSRYYSENVPAYLRSHPLTSDRMADITARIVDQRYKQHADAPDFHLMRARVRVLQDSSPQGLIDAEIYFNEQLKNPQFKLSADYGLAFIAYKRHEYDKAGRLLAKLMEWLEKSESLKNLPKQTSAFASLAIDISVAKKDFQSAIAQSKQAMLVLPLARGLVYQYVETLLQMDQPEKTEEAAVFLRDQVSLYRSDTKILNLLAKAYAAQGKPALQHIALAQAFAINTELEPAVLQLGLARLDPAVTYFDLSVIDALERDWKEQLRLEGLHEKRKR